MDISDLINNYTFHDMPVNCIRLDKETNKISINIDYFIDENNIQGDALVSLSINFHKCLSYQITGDSSLINNNDENINGTILEIEQFTDPRYEQNGVKAFIQVDNYADRTNAFLTLIMIPKEITVNNV